MLTGGNGVADCEVTMLHIDKDGTTLFEQKFFEMDFYDVLSQTWTRIMMITPQKLLVLLYQRGEIIIIDLVKQKK